MEPYLLNAYINNQLILQCHHIQIIQCIQCFRLSFHIVHLLYVIMLIWDREYSISFLLFRSGMKYVVFLHSDNHSSYL